MAATMAGDRYKKRQMSKKRKAQKEKEEWSDSDSEQVKSVKRPKKGISEVRKAVAASLDVTSVKHEALKQRFSLVIPGSSQPAVLLYSSQPQLDTANRLKMDTTVLPSRSALSDLGLIADLFE